MAELPTAPGVIRRALNRVRDALIGDDPEPEQLTGLDILGFFGQDAYDAWRAEGCPLVTFDQLAAHRATRPQVDDDRPDWSEVSRWIDENGRGPRATEQLVCGLCDSPAGESATVGDVLDHLRAVHRVRGPLAAKLVRVDSAHTCEDAARG